MNTVVGHKKILQDMDIIEKDKKLIYMNLEKIEKLSQQMNVYKQECDQVEKYNDQIKLQIQDITSTEGKNSLSAINLSKELMTPSDEAVSGIKNCQKKMDKLVSQNIDIINGRKKSNTRMTPIVVGALIWGIIFLIIFFGPKLRFPSVTPLRKN